MKSDILKILSPIFLEFTSLLKDVLGKKKIVRDDKKAMV